MKTSKFFSILCAALLVATTASAQQSAAAQQTAVQPGKFSIHVGMTALVFGGESFGGLALSVGMLATPKDLFMFEFNNGMGPSERIGSYSYVTYKQGSSSSSGTVHHDGKVSYVYNSIEAMVSYSRLFPIADKWQLRVGPALGVTGITAGDRYTDSFSGEVQGLPDPQTIRRNSFTGGALAGVRWNFSPRGSADLTYLVAGPGGVVFEERDFAVFDDMVEIDSKEFGNMSHRFNVTVGWRIGKMKQK